jgi:pimeloyl-ACP methyl ester carboxylesterase
MPIAEVNGQRIAYQDTGGDGPVVMFAHGLLMDRTMFDGQVAGLRDSYRCIAWDARGHGETGPVAEPWTFWDSARDQLALGEHLGVERAFLAGMSMGGFTDLRCALLRPDFVRGLVLIDTQAGQEDPDLVPQYQAMADVWSEHGLSDELAEMVAAIMLSPGAPSNPEWIAKWKALPLEHMQVPLQALFEREDIHDRLEEITAPALVIHGGVDAAIPLEKAQRLADGLPNCEGVVIVAGGGHAACTSHPEPVNAAMLDFLARHSAVTSGAAAS